jgi:hypothetical protein
MDNCHSKPTMHSIVGDYIYTVREVVVGFTDSEAAKASPERCVLMFWAANGATLSLVPGSVPNQSLNLQMAPSQLPLIFTARDHPGVVWDSWTVKGGALGSLLVFETFYRPQG